MRVPTVTVRSGAIKSVVRDDMNGEEEVKACSYKYFFHKKTVFGKRELLLYTHKYTQTNLNKLIKSIFIRILNK